MTTDVVAKYAVGVLVYDAENDLVLGVSRKHDPNDFGLPGGKLDFGESFIEAAVRELKEETGLDLLTCDYVYENVCGDSTRGDVLYYTVTYRATVSGSIHTNEAGRVAWVRPKKLVEGCFGVYNKGLFEKAGIKYT